MAVVVAVLAFAAPASAASSRYVGPGGDDGTIITPNDCATPGTPCLTINHAISQSADGDAIHVATGPYDEHVVVNKRVHLIGAQGGVDARTRSVPTTQESTVLQGFDVQTSGASIDGFLADDNGTASPGVQLSEAGSGYRVVNNIVRDYVTGISLGSNGVSQTLIQHNALIANNLGGSGTAISARSELGAVEIDANSMSGHGFKSLELDATYSSDVAITGNSSVSDGPMDLQNVHGGVVSGNTVTGSSGSGLSLAGGNSDVSVHANDITGSNGSGVSLATGPGGANQAISVVGNNLTGNHQYAISEGPAAMSGTLQAHFNRIFNNTVGGVFNDPANTTINAESNWWGCNEGPPGANCQGIGNDVDFTPWLVLRATAERGRVLTGGDTTPVRTGFSLSSALTQQVDASDFPATPVGFVATLGTVQSPATTSSGVAQTLFTSGAAPGTGTVTATLDNGGASANFEVSSQAGAQGTQGPPGPQGDPGPKGDTGDPGPSTPSSPAQPNPVLVLSNTLRATKQRIVSISVSCPNAAGLCDGRLGLGVGSSTLGNTAFLVNGGNRAVLRLKVSAAGLKAAIKKKKVTVVVLSRDNAGTAAFTTKVVKFRK